MMQSIRSVARPARQSLLGVSSSSTSAASTSLAAPLVLRQRIASATASTSAHPFGQRNMMLSTSMVGRSPFSTSTRVAKEAEKKDAEQAKEQETKAAGEAMGAKEGGEKAGEGNKELEELQAKLKEKDAKIKDLTDAVLYGKADLQNAQRRAQEEKTQAGDYAITKLARDLTATLDVLALALRSVPEPLRTAPADAVSLEDPRKAVAELYGGVELTSKSLTDTLKQHGVTSFDPTGEKFNPSEHEAMFQAPVPGKESGTVLECSKVGFKIKDRILRAAQVGVVQ